MNKINNENNIASGLKHIITPLQLCNGVYELTYLNKFNDVSQLTMKTLKGEMLPRSK